MVDSTSDLGGGLDGDGLFSAELSHALLHEYNKRSDSLYAKLYPPTGPYARDKYPLICSFFKDGLNIAQRFVWSANRTGKSLGGCYEDALHATQNYPDWWEGIRYSGNLVIWVVAHKFDNLRDPIQKYLLGDLTPGFEKEGLIPHRLIIGKPIKKIGVDTVYSSVKVRNKSGGISEIIFKAASEGWESFRGGNPSVIHLDDVDDSMVFSECQARLTDTTGINEENTGQRRLIVTATPEHGYTDTVLSAEKSEKEGYGKIYTISIYDVPHISDETRARRLAECPPHLIQPKIYGKPYIGAGQVIPIPEDEFTIKPIPIPEHWLLFGSIDTGQIETAVSYFAYDKDTDILYRIGESKFNNKNAIEIGASLSVRVKVPYVIDNQSKVVSQTDKRSVWGMLAALGLELSTPEKHDKETSINMLWERIASGRFKNFSTCTEFLYEYRLWQREIGGKIKNTKDHFIDTVLYGVRSGIQHGRTKFECYNPEEYKNEMEQSSVNRGSNNVLGGY